MKPRARRRRVASRTLTPRCPSGLGAQARELAGERWDEARHSKYFSVDSPPITLTKARRVLEAEAEVSLEITWRITK